MTLPLLFGAIMKEEKIIQYLIEKYSLQPVEDDKGLFVKDDNNIRLYWIDDIDGKEGLKIMTSSILMKYGHSRVENWTHLP